jgi:segregation and condensation protein A
LPLLLHLIERNELEVTSVSVVEVADQFLALMPYQGVTDMAMTSEFIAMAARLILLKSRALLRLPVETIVTDETHGSDAEDLARQIREYRRFQHMARWLAQRYEGDVRCVPRPPAPGTPAAPPVLSLDVALLPGRMRRLSEDIKIAPPPASMWPAVDYAFVRAGLLQRVRQLGSVFFVQLAADAAHPLVTITLFLAMLDAMRSRLLVAEQDIPFGPIRLSPALAPVQ